MEWGSTGLIGAMGWGGGGGGGVLSDEADGESWIARGETGERLNEEKGAGSRCEAEGGTVLLFVSPRRQTACVTGRDKKTGSGRREK